MELFAKRKDEEILLMSVNNQQFFNILVDRYQERFFRSAFAIVREEAEAEDIIQEAFIKIYSNADIFRNIKGASFKDWAYRIVINTAISHYRKRKKERGRYAPVNPEMYFGIADEKNPQKNLEERISVEQILRRVSHVHQKFVYMCYFEGESYEQIADKEDVPITTIKMRLFRARKMLKKVYMQHVEVEL